MVPYYQNRHARQSVGLEGPDLAEERRQELLAGAIGTSRDSIQQFDTRYFHVASKSRPGSYYEIDLNRSICNCFDFPRIRYCKHLAAISVHFPHLCTKESSPPMDLKFVVTSAPSRRVSNSEISRTSSPQESLQKLRQEIKLLSEQLDDKITGLTEESAPAVMQAVQSVKYSLTAAIASAQGSRALPDTEKVPPNQNSWTETAIRMGVKRAPKRRLPGEHGLTERSIGAPKARKRLFVDAYAGGERSGKLAKPDAQSAPANAHARAPPMLPPSALPPAPTFALARALSACIPGTLPQGSGFIPDSSMFLPVPGSEHFRSA